MKFEKKTLDNHRVQFIAEVEEKQFAQYKSIAARKISKESKIPGFRPGKAPYDVIERIYGEELIEERAVEELINTIYPEVIKESKIKPYGPGKLDEIISKNPPKYKFIVPLEPEVDVGEYTKIRQAYKLPQIQKNEIEEVIHDLQINYANAEEVSRESADGDLVSVKVSASLTKHAKEDNPEILKDTPHQVLLGEHVEDEQFPFKGFMKEITGLKKGDTKEVNYQYPADSGFENLQGKDVVFSVEVVSVKELKKPELNDDFAKMAGVETLENLYQSVEDQLTTRKKNEYENDYFEKLLNKLIKKSKIEYPPEMLDSEIEEVLRNFEQNIAQQNLDLDTYLKINKREKDDFISKEIEPAAKKRLEQSLILEEISKLEKIEIDQKQLQSEYSKSFLQMRSAPNYKKLQKKLTTKKISDTLIMQAASNIMHKNTLDRLKQIASGEIEKAPPIKKEKADSSQDEKPAEDAIGKKKD